MPKPAYSGQLTAGSGTVQSCKDLVVWQKAMDLSVRVYQLTKQFPKDEQFGLSAQIKRCAISIPSNIAEGKQRGTRKDFVQFLRIADGSASELETQLILATKLFSLKDVREIERLLKEVQRMLGGMLKKLSLPAVSRKLSTSNSYA